MELAKNSSQSAQFTKKIQVQLKAAQQFKGVQTQDIKNPQYYFLALLGTKLLMNLLIIIQITSVL